jgi:hypothetical protein
MAGSIADDSVALNTSRVNGEESGTNDERLERRMRRAVLDPAILDRSFSDEESNRVLRSSRRQKDKGESSSMDTTEQPADTSSSGDPVTNSGGNLPLAMVEAMETKQNSSNIANVAEKVEIVETRQLIRNSNELRDVLSKGANNRLAITRQ